MSQIVTAVYRDGQLFLESEVDWPEGQKVIVAKVGDSASSSDTDIRPEEAGWTDDPLEIQARIERLRSIEPWDMTPEEEKSWLDFREQGKQVSLDAVRRDMGLEP